MVRRARLKFMRLSSKVSKFILRILLFSNRDAFQSAAPGVCEIKVSRAGSSGLQLRHLEGAAVNPAIGWVQPPVLGRAPTTVPNWTLTRLWQVWRLQIRTRCR